MLCIFFASCKRQDVIGMQNYTFSNSTAEHVTLDIYNSEEDYDNNRNRSSTHRIPVSGSVSIQLQAMTSVWVDWYNDDLTLHNWSRRQSSGWSGEPLPLPRIDVAAADDHYTIRGMIKDTARSILLPGNASSSTWKAEISSDPTANGTHTFIFRKDFGGEYTFVDMSGNSVMRPIAFEMINDEQSTRSFYLNVTDKDGASYIASLHFNSLFSPANTKSRDTLVGYMINSGTDFWLVRQ